MTTVQTMLCASLLGVLAMSGCSSEKDVLVTPNVIQSPYPATQGETLWVIAPLMNESGVSTVDTLAVSDALVAAVSQVNGISALPLNRTLAAMNARQLKAIRSPRDAKILADALKAQGVLVGSITAYDPYDPPKIGLTLALYTMDVDASQPVDPRQLSSSYSDRSLPKSSFSESPSSVVSEHFDAANHDVLISLREFAVGRHDPNSALSWKRYTASMELYTEFAVYQCTRQLAQSERRRLAGGAPPAPAGSTLPTAAAPLPTPATHPAPHVNDSPKPSETLTHAPSGDTK